MMFVDESRHPQRTSTAQEDALLRAVEGTRLVARLLVLASARTPATHAAHRKATSRQRICPPIQLEDAGRDRHVLRRDGQRAKECLREYLFRGICCRAGRACTEALCWLAAYKDLVR